VLQVPRIRERAPVAARTGRATIRIQNQTSHLEPGRVIERRRRRRRREAATALTSCRRATPAPAAAATRPALRRRMSVASAANGRAADLGWLGFYPEVEARRRGHPRRARARGGEIWELMGGLATPTTSRGVERVI